MTLHHLMTEMKIEADTNQDNLQQILSKAKLDFPIGTKVKILNTDYIGEVDHYNESSGGFYPGYRYPIFVKITDCVTLKFKQFIGRTFQYSLDQLQIIDDK